MLPTQAGGRLGIVLAGVIFLQLCGQMHLLGDGVVLPKRQYTGSLEEKSQEAILIFQPADSGTSGESAVQDLILSIEVVGEADEFAWVIPFPSVPTVHQESDDLFKELFDFVEERRVFRAKSNKSELDQSKAVGAADIAVHSRNVVGDYELVIVSELRRGSLNEWLEQNGYRPLPAAEDVIEFYRSKRYVFACIKYTSEALAREGKINSHPLRFRFATGGRDAMYFPMKMTGLQNEPFDVTLYVFCPSWINYDLNQFGFIHRGFRLDHRDWDTTKCKPNAGKVYSTPQKDPYLQNSTANLTTVSRLFQRLYPGQGFYLTKIRASGLVPREVRQWSDDLWLFPHYVNRSFIPLDVQQGGPAAAAWPEASRSPARTSVPRSGAAGDRRSILRPLLAVVIFAAALICIPLVMRRLLHFLSIAGNGS